MYEPFDIAYTSDLTLEDLLDGDSSRFASEKVVDRYWSGEKAPENRFFTARAAWSIAALYVEFEAMQMEPLVVNDQPDAAKKTVGLWERDVCELFITPNMEVPRKYFEFEVAPTGEWLDLAIDVTSGQRVTDWEYDSGMEAAARIEECRVLMAMKIPWEAFGRKPRPGDVWLGNIFRCVGGEPNRGYIAWRPTMTDTPNFHVPERSGQLIFDN